MPDALSVSVDPAELRALFLKLKAADGNLQVQLRRGMTAAAKPLVQEVKSAASWSTRIPAAVKAKTSFSAKSTGISITVNSKKAPEAAPLENKGNSGTFKHPVFGNRRNWVSQAARPFFKPTLKNAKVQIQAALLKVMSDVAKQAGFH